MSIELYAIALISALGWFWHDSLTARELAVHAAREACKADGLLFLDDTVGIASIKLARNDAGRLNIQRAYDFEFSDTGNNRLPGSVVLRGSQVVLLNLGARRWSPRVI